MFNHALNPDTQAILLLYGRFGKGSDTDVQPLTTGEYNRLAQWLNDHGLRPSALLHEQGERVVSEMDVPISAERLQALLRRGGGMAFAVEDWTSKGLWIVSRSDSTYPQRLKSQLKRLAPPILYGIGNRELLEQGGLAVVGSRDADSAGLDATRRIALAWPWKKAKLSR